VPIGQALSTAMPDEATSLDLARIENRQMPMFSRDLRTVAVELRLDWVRARGLWAAGLLSFDPDGVIQDEVCEAEFVFLGSLAAAGLSNDQIESIVRGLRRPYAYDMRRIYFDWQAGVWRLLPGADDAEAAFFAMIARIDPCREARVLLEIRELVETALDLARGRRAMFGHESPATRWTPKIDRTNANR